MPVVYREDASRQGLITLGLVAAIVLVGWLLLWPAYGGWNKDKEELAVAQSDLAKRQATLDSYSRLIANYDSKKTELAVLDTSLPNAPKVPQLLFNMESLVVQSGLKMGSIKITDPTVAEESYKSAPAKAPSPDKGIPHPALVELKIDLNLEGDYGALRGFLEALERNQRLLEVRSLTASPASGTGQSAGATFGLTLSTVYQK